MKSLEARRRVASLWQVRSPVVADEPQRSPKLQVDTTVSVILGEADAEIATASSTREALDLI